MGKWFSSNPAKAKAEKIFLGLAVYWISGLMIYVGFKFHEHEFFVGPNCNHAYTVIGLLAAIPYLLVCFFPEKSEKQLPFYRRYAFKIQVWVFFFGFVGNYFWTHYFYNLLAATFTFCQASGGHTELNGVPLVNYLLTHAYFNFYFVVACMLQRRVSNMVPKTAAAQFVGKVLTVAVSAYVTAFMEAYTLEEFPFYAIQDRHAMYVYGSAFYCIYFLVGFPMVIRVDETTNTHSLYQTSVESLASAMLVFILLDLWRIAIGVVTTAPGVNDSIPPFAQVPQ